MIAITYPMRPMSGGPIQHLTAGQEGWAYEPKYNGWRALVHVPSGTMWNRGGELLTIQSEFAYALDRLKAIGLDWLDCEALERRHNIGRGSLIILDAPELAGSYANRRATLEMSCFKADILPHYNLNKPVPDNSVLLVNAYKPSGIPQLCFLLEDCNKALGCEFFEGVVAKRVESQYNLQLNSTDAPSANWKKYRWDW